MARAMPILPILSFLILIIDLAAGILAIEAEEAQNKMISARVWIFECKDPSHKAFKLGLAAALLMAVAHAVANAFGGCTCIWSRQELDNASHNQQLAVAYVSFSWIVFVVGFSMLVAGALNNSRPRGHCGLSHHHLLSIGGILCFIHGLLPVAYYVSSTAFNREHSGASA